MTQSQRLGCTDGSSAHCERVSLLASDGAIRKRESHQMTSKITRLTSVSRSTGGLVLFTHDQIDDREHNDGHEDDEPDDFDYPPHFEIGKV